MKPWLNGVTVLVAIGSVASCSHNSSRLAFDLLNGQRSLRLAQYEGFSLLERENPTAFPVRAAHIGWYDHVQKREFTLEVGQANPLSVRWGSYRAANAKHSTYYLPLCNEFPAQCGWILTIEAPPDGTPTLSLRTLDDTVVTLATRSLQPAERLQRPEFQALAPSAQVFGTVSETPGAGTAFIATQGETFLRLMVAFSDLPLGAESRRPVLTLRKGTDVEVTPAKAPAPVATPAAPPAAPPPQSPDAPPADAGLGPQPDAGVVAPSPVAPPPQSPAALPPAPPSQSPAASPPPPSWASP